MRDQESLQESPSFPWNLDHKQVLEVHIFLKKKSLKTAMICCVYKTATDWRLKSTRQLKAMREIIEVEKIIKRDENY